jgi:CVNH domain
MVHRHPITMSLFFMLVVGTSSVPTAAWANSFPPGDYSLSCTDISTTGTSLSARCKDFNQNLGGRTTLLNFGTCIGNIGNVDGVLRCIRTDTPPPHGSYLETCTDTKLGADNVLFARCRNINEDWLGTQLQMSGCQQPVRNVDGHLSCDRTDLQGSFSDTCWDIRLDGDTVLATCRAMSGAPIETRLERLSHCSTDSAGTRPLFNIDGSLSCLHSSPSANGAAPPSSGQPPPTQCQPGNPQHDPHCGATFNPTGPFPGPSPFKKQTVKPAVSEVKKLPTSPQ